MSKAGSGEMSMAERLELLARYHAGHAGAAATGAYQAPGRVNLLGEHTDYSGGFCMPAALSFNTLVTASPRMDTLLRLHSMDFEETVEFDLRSMKHAPKSHWSAYCAGVAWSLGELGVEITAADLSFSGDVPVVRG